MLSVDLMSLWTFVCSVHLCYSVRNRTHPRYEKMSMRFAGEFYLSRRIFLSLTELTDLTEPFCARFELIREWPLPQPLPRREGRDMWGSPYWAACVWRGESFLLCWIFSSHRTHRFNRTYLRTVSNAQNASGIQISQNVIAKGGCWVMSGRCWWLANVGCKVLCYRLT